MIVLHVLLTGANSSGTWLSFVERHYALRRIGIDSRILCVRGADQASGITEINHRYSRVKSHFIYRLKKTSELLGISHIPDNNCLNISRTLKNMECDIIHVSSSRYPLSYLSFPSVSKVKPIICSVSSMWGFTGSCLYSFKCDKWKTGCSRCKHLEYDPPVKRDAAHIEWKMKNWAYSRSKLNLIVESDWVREQIKKSMMSRFPVNFIPPPVDTENFRPLDREQCRSKLGIPLDKNVLMFSSVYIEDYRKGVDLLLKALNDLPHSLKSETVLLLMGKGGDKIAKAVTIPIVDVGYVVDNHFKAICYSAADLFLFPTRADAFGLVSIESQACGTPVVSFRTGGVPDHVHPGLTGYLSEPEDVDDFKNGIVQLLKDEPLRKAMGNRCREIVHKRYNTNLWAKRFSNLCHSLVNS